MNKLSDGLGFLAAGKELVVNSLPRGIGVFVDQPLLAFLCLDNQLALELAAPRGQRSVHSGI